MALIVVIWIALGLVAVALLFGDGMRMEYRAAANSAAAIEAGQTLEGAHRYLAFVLGNATSPGVFPDAAACLTENVPVGEASFWIIGRTDQDIVLLDLPHFGWVDEASKLNLNTATREMLEALPDMPPDLAAAIVDWRDPDDDPEPNGAESNAYHGSELRYACKNAPFESVEELRWVRGATLALLWGEDTNLNGVLDPNENDGNASFPDDNADGKLRRALTDFVTVFSEEPNTRPDGSPRIDVRRWQRREMSECLEQSVGAERGAQITNAIQQAGGRIESVLEFYLTGGVTADEAAKLDDSLTAHDGPMVQGRVNVNTAPREVLRCLPGIGDRYADALVTFRQTKTADQLASPLWLRDVVDPASAALAGPYITTRSYRISADIAAVAAHGRAIRRSWMVFDTSRGQPIVLYRSDRTHAGWPLGMGVRNASASIRKAWEGIL